MKEVLEDVQDTPLQTLFKAVCKKWLLIGFLMIIGGILGCVIAFAAMPLTKDVYEASFYLTPSNQSADKNMNYYNDQNIAIIKSYLGGAGYKNHVFLSIKDDILKDITDTEKREAQFKKNVTVSVGDGITVYVMNQEKDAAMTIFNAFVSEAKKFVVNMIDGMKDGEDAQSIGISVVVPIGMIKANPKEISIQGYIGISDRITAVIVGALLGIVAGAAIAVCIYYFNNRLNSVHMLTSLGFTQVYVDKKHKNAPSSIYSENALRYNFVIGKEGCKVITFISPVKTDETAKAFSEQAASMRKYGYRVSEVVQNGQTSAQWKEMLVSAAPENDFVLVNAAAGDSFDCAVPGALSDGIVVVIDQKSVKMKQLKYTKETIKTAKLNTLAVFVINTREDFIQ